MMTRLFSYLFPKRVEFHIPGVFRTGIRRILRISLFLFFPAPGIFFSPVFAAPVSRDGVSLEIAEEKREFDRFVFYRVYLKNETGSPASVAARILLTSARTGKVNECTLFYELSPGESRTENTLCMQEDRAGSWKFELVRVFPFVLSP